MKKTIVNQIKDFIQNSSLQSILRIPVKKPVITVSNFAHWRTLTFYINNSTENLEEYSSILNKFVWDYNDAFKDSEWVLSVEPNTDQIKLIFYIPYKHTHLNASIITFNAFNIISRITETVNGLFIFLLEGIFSDTKFMYSSTVNIIPEEAKPNKNNMSTFCKKNSIEDVNHFLKLIKRKPLTNSQYLRYTLE